MTDFGWPSGIFNICSLFDKAHGVVFEDVQVIFGSLRRVSRSPRTTVECWSDLILHLTKENLRILKTIGANGSSFHLRYTTVFVGGKTQRKRKKLLIVTCYRPHLRGWRASSHMSSRSSPTRESGMDREARRSEPLPWRPVSKTIFTLNDKDFRSKWASYVMERRTMRTSFTNTELKHRRF